MASRPALAARLEALADHMLDVAAEMEFFGGFDQELINKSRELAGASALARQWAESICPAYGEQGHGD